MLQLINKKYGVKKAQIILNLISKTIFELDNFNSQYYISEREPNTRAALLALKNEIVNNPDNINKRVLRGMSDLGIYSYKTFEQTELAKAIVDLNDEICEQIPSFINMEPLGEDFGKGNPI
jgi:hypothetical protein